MRSPTSPATEMRASASSSASRRRFVWSRIDLERSSYALMVSLLPATAVAVGILVLGQTPSPQDGTGVALVMAGVAAHRGPAQTD